MFFEKWFDQLDAWLRRSVTGFPDGEGTEPDATQEKVLKNEIEGHFRPRRRLQKSDTEIVFEVFGIIDQKAGAMLTHVSVMIAANALLLTIDTNPLLDLFSIVLMVLFIGVALLTLRLLRFWSTDFHGPGSEKSDI